MHIEIWSLGELLPVQFGSFFCLEVQLKGANKQISRVSLEEFSP